MNFTLPLCNVSAALGRGRWAIGGARSESPRVRWGHTLHVLAHHGEREPSSVLLMFGGEVPFPGPFASMRTDELWSLDTHLRWQLVRPSSSASPTTRRLHASAVIDGVSLLMSGGLGRDSWPVPDLWSLRLTDGPRVPVSSSSIEHATLGAEWLRADMQVVDDAAAFCRFGHSMVHVQGSTPTAVLVFGGLTARDGCDNVLGALDRDVGGHASRMGGEAVALNDVLQLRQLSGSWRLDQLSPPSEVDSSSALFGRVPCGRQLHSAHWFRGELGSRSACSDPGCMLVFGGRSQEGAALGDLWAWNPAASNAHDGWQQLHPLGRTAPSERSAHTAALVANALYLLGGTDGAGAEPLNDLWRLDLRELRWRRMLTHSDSPAPRYGASMVHLQPGGVDEHTACRELTRDGRPGSVSSFWGDFCGSK